MKKIITLLSCMIIAQSFYAQSEKTIQERLDKFDKALNQKISGDGAGLSIIITHKNNVVSEKYMGYADFETMEKLNMEFDFNLGVKLWDWASIDYIFKAYKLPMIFNDWQIMNSLLVSINFSIVSDPEPAG